MEDVASCRSGIGASGPPSSSNLDKSSSSSGSTMSRLFFLTDKRFFITMQTTAGAATGNRGWFGIMVSMDDRLD
jgi:hypothetical protein